MQYASAQRPEPSYWFELARIVQRVFACAKPSVLGGKPIPEQPLEELAPEALPKLGYVVQPSQAQGQ